MGGQFGRFGLLSRMITLIMESRQDPSNDEKSNNIRYLRPVTLQNPLQTPEYGTLAVEALDSVRVTVETTSTSFTSFVQPPWVIELPKPPIAAWQARHGDQRTRTSIASVEAAAHDYAKTRYGLHRAVWSSPSIMVQDYEHERQAKSWTCTHPLLRAEEVWLAQQLVFTYRQLQLFYWNGAPRLRWWLSGVWRRGTTNGYGEPLKREKATTHRPQKPSRWSRFLAFVKRSM